LQELLQSVHTNCIDNKIEEVQTCSFGLYTIGL